MKLETVSIPAGEIALAGLRYVPDTNRRPVALLFAHGFSSGKYSLDSLAGYLAMRGYEGLTFDFVGHKLGGSGGEMRAMRQAPENLRDALVWLRQCSVAEDVVLIGHSMGAAAALQVAAWEQASPKHAAIPLSGIVCMCMGIGPSRGFDSPIGQAMLAQREDYVAGAPALQLLTEINDMVRAVDGIGTIPALFIAAKQDVLVSVQRVEELASHAPDSAMEVVETTHLEAPDRSRAPIYKWLARFG